MLSNTTECGAGLFPRPNRPTMRMAGQMINKPTSIIRSQQTEDEYPDTARLKRELEKIQCERDQAALESDQMRSELEQIGKLPEEAANRGQLKSEIEQVRKLQLEAATRDQVKLELEQLQKLQQQAATRDQLNSELKQIQKLQQEAAKNRCRKANTPSKLLARVRGRIHNVL